MARGSICADAAPGASRVRRIAAVLTIALRIRWVCIAIAASHCVVTEQAACPLAFTLRVFAIPVRPSCGPSDERHTTARLNGRRSGPRRPLGRAYDDR